MLSVRLQTIANFITLGNRLVDVGTDHAYLPIYAVEQGICRFAVAADIRPGPLAAARQHIAEHGLSCVEARISDGLHEICPGEGETLTISGMGGLLIVKILSEMPAVTASFQEIILGPQSELFAVRQWMSQHWTIAEDTMVKDDGKYYPVIRYIPGGEQLTETELRFGKCRNDTVREYLEREKMIREKILSGLTDQTERIREITADLELIGQALLQEEIS